MSSSALSLTLSTSGVRRINWSGQGPAFLHVKYEGDEVVVDGLDRVALGNRIYGDEAGGLFAEWNWDGATVSVAHDPYGYYPLYYFATDGEFAISTSIRKLLECGAPRDLDYRALSVYVRLGSFLGDDTPFTAIRALPQGAAGFRWDRTGLLIERCESRPGWQTMGREAALDAYIELFREAVARRIPTDGQCLVPVGGGAASRHVVLELHRQGVQPTCITARRDPAMNSKEHIVAKKLARHLELECVVAKQPKSGVRAELEKNERVSWCAADHGWFGAIAGHDAVAIAGSIFDGLGGSVLSGGVLLDENRDAQFRERRLDDLAEILLGPDNAWLETVLAKWIVDQIGRETARDYLRRHLEPFVGAPNPLGAFLFANRTRRSAALAPLAMLPRDCAVQTPFLDGEVYELLASLPAAFFMDKRFHHDAIRRAFPSVEEVPYTNEPRFAMQPGWSRRYLRETMRALRRRGKRLLRIGKVDRRVWRSRFSKTYRADFVRHACPWMLYFAQLNELSNS